MDCLDPMYSALKKESNNSNKTAAEKAKAADKLAAREKHLQPTHRQLALLYADLHQWPHFISFFTSIAYQYFFSRKGCMEAKGCAKPAVWKEARCFFYWALRQKNSQLKHIKAIQESSPAVSSTDAKGLLFSLLPATLDSKDNLAFTEALERPDIEPTLSEIQEAEITCQVTSFLRSQNRKATLKRISQPVWSRLNSGHKLSTCWVKSVS